MKAGLNRRLEELEESTITKKIMLLKCDREEDLERAIAEWEALPGEPDPNRPLIYIQNLAYRKDKKTA